MANNFSKRYLKKPVTPIYDGGRLTGVEDPNTQQSRLPTPAERIIYGRPSQGGGGGGGGGSPPAPVEATPVQTTETTVTVGGQTYSVPKEKQPEFIKSQIFLTKEQQKAVALKERERSNQALFTTNATESSAQLSRGQFQQGTETALNYIQQERQVRKTVKQKVTGIAVEKTYEYGFGEKGREIYRIPSIPIMGISGKWTKSTPVYKFKQEISSAGLVPAVISEFIPETYGEAGLMVGIGYGYTKLPTIGRVGVSSITSVLGTKVALTPSEQVDKRIAGGIVGVTAGVGTVFEALPFIRGAKATVPVKVQPEGYKGIETSEQVIGIIPRGYPKTGAELPSTSPLVRGAFHVKPSEKFQFLGADQTVGTSQISFGGISKPKVGQVIPPTPEKPLFFVTPQEPTLKIPVTRESRLGIISPFEFPKGTRIGFGVPKQPQIFIEEGVSVTRAGYGSSYKLGKGSELEATKKFPTITILKNIGATRIKGQGVDIYKIRTSYSPTGVIRTPSTKITSTSYEIPSRISGETLLSVPITGVIRGLQGTSTSSSITTSTVYPSTTSFTSKGPYVSSPPIISPIPSGGGGGSSPSIIDIERPSPIRIITPIISLTITPRAPTITTPRTTKRTTPTPPRPPTNIERITGWNIRGSSFSIKPKSPTYTVSVRRGGKFKTIGTNLSLPKAFQVGQYKTATTLGATFKVTPSKGIGIGNFITPSGYYSKYSKKEGTVFIEKPKYRLSTVGEKLEIKSYRRKKKR